MSPDDFDELVNPLRYRTYGELMEIARSLKQDDSPIMVEVGETVAALADFKLTKPALFLRRANTPK